MFRKTNSAAPRPQHSPTNNDPDKTLQETEIGRRLFFARAVELASTAPLVLLGGRNALNHRDYATIDRSQAKVSVVDAGREAQVMAGSLAALDTALGALQEAYRSAYHKSRVVPYTTTNSKGHLTVRFRTEYYWDEEFGVPDHGVIDSWRAFSSSMLDKVSELSKPELLDVSKLDKLTVTKEHAGSISQIGGSLLITAAGVAALLGYEEMVGLREHRMEADGAEAESREHFRRGFLKYGAAVAAAGASMYISGRIDSRLGAGKERMNQAVDSAVNLGEISREAAFSGHFGVEPLAISSEIRSCGLQAQGTVNHGIRNTRVKQAMEYFAAEATRTEATIKELFQDTIPLELANRCKSAIITKAINTATVGESSLGEFGVVLEGLSAGAAMTAAIVITEGANRYVGSKTNTAQADETSPTIIRSDYDEA